MKKIFHKPVSIIVGSLLVTWIGASFTFAQDYFYYNFETPISLFKVEDKYGIQFFETVTEEDRLSFLTSLNLEIIRLTRKPTGFSIARSRNTQIDVLPSLTQSPLVQHATPLLRFSDGTECLVVNRFIVEYKSHMTRAAIDILNDNDGVTVVEKYPYKENVYLLKVDSGGTLAALDMANQYNRYSDVEYAAPDLMLFIKLHGVTPNDPLFSNQWHLSKIKAPDAWEISKGNSSVIAAVVDEGVDLQQEDLINRFFRDGGGNIIGTDVTDQGDNSPQPLNDDAHGSACAGIIAAQTNNQKGVFGVDWNCKIMPIQIGHNPFELGYYDWVSFPSWQAAGIDFAWQNSAHILSNSWGSGSANPAVIQAIENAATLGRDPDGAGPLPPLGAVVLFSSGNTAGQPVDFPANLDNFVIAVGATDQNDVKWDYSTYGTSLDVVAPSGNTGGGLVDVDPEACLEAPPHLKVLRLIGDIWTTDISGSGGYNPDNCHYVSDPPQSGVAINYTARFSGTSGACPFVSGTAALILSINSTLTRQQVQDILQNSADKVHPELYNYNMDPNRPGWSDQVGYGRLNAYQALLLTHAYSNKSVSSTATASNNGRRMVKTSDGRYHLVFESGITSNGQVLSEIFYRRSNVGGTSWDPPVRLSAGNEQNRYASIKDGATLGLPILRITTENLAETQLLLTAPISAFAGNEVSLSTQVSGIKPSLIASLGHIYEFVEEPLPQALARAAETTTPNEFVFTAYPNPFNPSTQIRFTLASESLVTLRIYNVAGQMVRELLHEQQRPAGEHTMLWDGRDGSGHATASGIYFMRLESGNTVKVSKLTMLR